MSETAVALRPGVKRSWRRSIWLVIPVTFVSVVAVFALFGPLIAPKDPNTQTLTAALSPPSKQYWLGTDNLGRDIFARIVVGTRSAVIGPILIATALMLLSTVLGLLAGYKGGWVDTIISRWVDFMYSLPPLIVAILVVGIFGGGYFLAVATLILLITPYDTRLIRGGSLEQRPLPYVEAAIALGLSDRKVMVRHILPNLVPLIIAVGFLEFAIGIVALSALSFLGLGVPPGTPDWGRTLAESRTHLFDNPAWALAPTFMIVGAAASMNVIGDWLHERLAERGRVR